MALKILLADDSLTSQNMGKKILTEAGYQVIAVSNGAQAMKKIAAEKPDLVVLDVYMPGYSGLEVCELMRNTRETERTPVLLSVGKMEPFDQGQGNRVRADGLIIKPFEATELVATVEKLAEKIPPAPHRQEPAAEESAPEYESFQAAASPAEAQDNATEPELEARVEVPQEMAVIPAAGMEWILESAATASEPDGQAIEFEVEREPEPVNLPEPVRMASADGFSGVFEMEPSKPAPAPEAPKPVEDFDRFSAAAPQFEPQAGQPQVTPEPEHTIAYNFSEAPHAVQVTAPEVEQDASSLGQGMSGAEPGVAAPQWASENSAPAEPIPEFTPVAPQFAVKSAPAPAAAGLTWMAEEAVVGDGETGISLEQEMMRAGMAADNNQPQPAEATVAGTSSAPAETALPAAEAAASAFADYSAAWSETRPQPAADFAAAGENPAVEQPPHWRPEPYRVAASQPVFTSQPEPAMAAPDAEAAAAAPAVAEPEVVAAVEAVAAHLRPQLGAAVVGEIPVDPARLASIVDRVLERLKPELISEITRELGRNKQ